MALGPKALGNHPNEDPYYESTIVNLNFDNNLNDLSPKKKTWNTINAGVQPAYTATNVLFGSGSYYIPLTYAANSCTDIVTTSGLSDFAHPSNKFTFEIWWYPTAVSSGVISGYDRTGTSYEYFGGWYDQHGVAYSSTGPNWMAYNDHGRICYWYRGNSVPLDNALSGGWYGPRSPGDTRTLSGTSGTSRPLDGSPNSSQGGGAQYVGANMWNWIVIQQWDTAAGSATAFQGVKTYINGKLHNINTTANATAYSSPASLGVLLGSWFNTSNYTAASSSEPAGNRYNACGYFDGFRLTNGVIRYPNLGTGSDTIPVPKAPPLP